jgi:hypothetical protein
MRAALYELEPDRMSPREALAALYALRAKFCDEAATVEQNFQ